MRMFTIAALVVLPLLGGLLWRRFNPEGESHEAVGAAVGVFFLLVVAAFVYALGAIIVNTVTTPSEPSTDTPKGGYCGYPFFDC